MAANTDAVVDTNKPIVSKVVVMPFMLNDWICYEFGTRFRIRQVNRLQSIRKMVKLDAGAEDGVFIGQFTDDDTDFEIEMDNVMSSKNISYTIQSLTTITKKCFLRRGNQYIHRTIESEGKHLHFTGGSLYDIDDIIESRATRYGVTQEQSRHFSTRLKVIIETEKMLVPSGPAINVSVKYMITVNELSRKQVIVVRMGADNTVGQLKRQIDYLEGIPSTEQILIYKQHIMTDRNRLRLYGIGNDDSVELELKVLGGAQVDEKMLSNAYGQRGVIYGSRRTIDRYIVRDDGFVADDELHVQPFVIELRYNDSADLIVRQKRI
ncbi:uncharacterized protein LOC128953988 [Oppia nitens]|uniref:uncharacterized protein LOC128953988 n=1 Tax=Oppia nitens TaxID=1686743 RepID=UPI0023DA80EB|nr:uncharacterized protein LOC128953988 [Oppia nitens]